MKWRVIHLRARAEFDEGWRSGVCTCAQVRDDHGNEIPHGEPLWPERWNCVRLQDKTKDPQVWGSSYQGKPTIGEGYWLAKHTPQHYEKIDPKQFNVYMLVDPALSKGRRGNNCVVVIVGLGADRNFYLLDMIRAKLGMDERLDAIFRLHRQWNPLGVGYEEYGANADHVILQARMEEENYRFPLTILGREGEWHNMGKPDRIRTMVAQVKGGRWWFPKPGSPNVPTTLHETVKRFMDEEWMKYHGAANCVDDGLDALTRINDPDMHIRWPKTRSVSYTPQVNAPGVDWMGM